MNLRQIEQFAARAAGARRVLLIHNPSAGQRRAGYVGAVIAALGATGTKVEVAPTRAQSDAEAFARMAVAERFDVVAVAGGDGTINEVVNGLRLADMALAIVPCGTANVLARELALPSAPVDLARVIAAGRERRVHLGIANGRRFVMMAGVGLDARAVATVSLPLKRAVGKLAYGVSILGAIVTAPSRAPYVVTIEGEAKPAAWVVAARGRHYAGGFVVAPRADLAARAFEVCLCPKGGRLNALRYLGSLGAGLFTANGDVRFIQAASLRVEGPIGAPVQADGEIIARLPVDIAIHAEPLRVIAP